MVGDDEDRGVSRKLLDYPTGHGIKSFIDPSHRISKAGLALRVMQEMATIHVRPEVVLDSVYRHEDKHHYVLRMRFLEVLGDCRPLPVELFQFG